MGCKVILGKGRLNLVRLGRFGEVGLVKINEVLFRLITILKCEVDRTFKLPIRLVPNNLFRSVIVNRL